jgi:hypothetical protein
VSNPTASKLELAIVCPSSFALEHRDVRVDGSDPERGKSNHARREEEIKAGRIPEQMANRWPGFTWQAEVKVCYDLATDTGEIFGYGNDRGYEDRGPFVVFGTADAVGDNGTETVVLDFKGYNEQTPAERNPQVSILALAVTRALGRTSATVAIAPEVGVMDVAHLSALDLDAFAATARDSIAAVMRAREQHRKGMPMTFTEGRHCLYCPALHACPPKQATALMLRGDPALQLDLTNDNDAADAYEFAQKVRQLLKRLDGAIYARAADRPIPLVDGRVFGQITKPGNEELDGDVVWREVSARHGRDIADTAVIRSATKTRLKEALQFAGVDSVAKAEREVIDAVRKAGGSHRKESTSIRAYDPAKLIA